MFGLVNPVIYLTVLMPSMPGLRADADRWWLPPLMALAWLLLSAIWLARVVGGALDAQSALVRAGTRALLGTALGCLVLFIAKDLRLLFALTSNGEAPLGAVLSGGLRLGPFYLIPAVLLIDYFRAAAEPPDVAPTSQLRLFLLRNRAARAAAAALGMVALATTALAVYRPSDAAVRALVREHRDAIREAAARYDVDPRVIGAIVYVTHRDQLSPFRDALERMAMRVWVQGYWQEIGANETMLNRPLDLSVGLAQVKPRTAQTASLLASRLEPTDLSQTAMAAYRDAEPAGDAWESIARTAIAMPTPFPVPTTRQVVARALLDADSNLATCALILALYQQQWEAASPAFSIRARPDILATLYQIGFARSRPHNAPRSNAFGARVREVHAEPWLNAMFANGELRSAK